MKKTVFILFFATLAWILFGAVIHAADEKKAAAKEQAASENVEAFKNLATEKNNIAVFRLKKILLKDNVVLANNKNEIENFKSRNPKATKQQLNEFHLKLPVTIFGFWEGLKAEILAFKVGDLPDTKEALTIDELNTVNSYNAGIANFQKKFIDLYSSNKNFKILVNAYLTQINYDQIPELDFSKFQDENAYVKTDKIAGNSETSTPGNITLDDFFFGSTTTIKNIDALFNYYKNKISEPEPTPFYRRAVSFLGLIIMLFIAWTMSSAKLKMNWRLIITGVALQIVFGILVLWTAPGEWFFEGARYIVAKIVGFSDEGAKFVFGDGFQEHYFAFSVLPTIIFVSSMMSVLFYLGIIQSVVKGMAWVMVKVMDVSGSESLASAANVFVGQTEAPLVILPYIKTMTRSELMAMMVGGMATVAGGVMAAYAAMGADAGHLLSASIMSAPATLVIAKIMIPERESSLTKGIVKVEVEKPGENVLDAACSGASSGLKLAANVAAMLIAFIALIYLGNWILGGIGSLFGWEITLQKIMGWIFSPLAWIMGVEGHDMILVGQTIGEKTILNEFVAYTTLVSDNVQPHISERSFTIATYALCGFANFSSIAIQIGGIGALVPERRKDLAKLGLRAMIGGTLAAFMTACIAGMLIR